MNLAKRAILLAILMCLSFNLKAQIKVNWLSERVGQIEIADGASSVKATLIRNGEKAVLVDAMYGTFAADIAEYITEQGLKVEHIINTHYHGDHTQGNVNFRGTPIIAHENTYQNIADSAQYGPETPFTESDMPDKLFKESLKLYLDDLLIEVVHFSEAHTTGDAIVFVPQENIACVGDIMLAPNTLPYTANPDSFLEVLKQIEERLDDQTQIITGHGNIASKADVENLIDIVNETIKHVKSGKGIDDYPKDWNKWDSSFISMKNWLSLLGQIYK